MVITHKETFPKQYLHPLVGKTVQYGNEQPFIVERVVTTTFGYELTPLPNSNRVFKLNTLTIIKK